MTIHIWTTYIMCTIRQKRRNDYEEVVRMHYYDYNCGYGDFGYGYVAPTTGYGNGFALIVVLFILLIIVGAAYLGC